MSHKTPRNPSASQYQFSLNPSVNIPRCSLSRPFSHKTTIDAGLLYPLYCQEVLPGDTFNVDMSIIARLTTPLVPFMDNLYLDCHFFFVPYRLVWSNFVKMMGEQDNPSDTINYTVPTLAAKPAGFDVGSLHDYFGVPTGVPIAAGDVSALPFRCYNAIWNAWYRDEDLQQSLSVNEDSDGPDSTNYALRYRNKRKDMFTSARPWPQKGDNVVIPLAGDAPVVGTGMNLGLTPFVTTSGSTAFRGLGAYGGSSGALTGLTALYGGNTQQTSTATVNPSGSTVVGVGVTKDPAKSGLVADLSNVSASSINDLRTAFQIQKFLEASARGGTRYTEILYSMFGVTNPDLRLQRPELLGTVSVPVSVNSVPQTSASEDGTSPQGNLAAYATAVGVRHAFDKSFTEFGLVMGLVSIRSDLTYQQGLPRWLSRRSRFDFYWPLFAHLGEQAILNKEIYFQGPNVVDTDGNRVDDLPFGYAERWAEYKYSPSMITGQLRSTYAQSLDYWHLAQKFDALPTLAPAFIRENPPIQRVVSVTDVPQFVVDSYFRQNCVRPMPLYSIPGLIDHF